MTKWLANRVRELMARSKRHSQRGLQLKRQGNAIDVDELAKHVEGSRALNRELAELLTDLRAALAQGAVVPADLLLLTTSAAELSELVSNYCEPEE